MKDKRKYKITISIIVGIFTLFYIVVQIINALPQTVETVSKFLSREQSVTENVPVPTGVIGEVDYGIPIVPLKPLANGSSTIVILTVGVAGQPLGFTRVFFSVDDEVYGPYLTDQNGMLIIPNVKGANYSISGFYKGFTVVKKIALLEGQRRLYVLSFPVFIELLGIPFDFPSFVCFLIGVVLLIIVLAIIIVEYSNLRKAKLLRRTD